ncbi:ABC transporter substrate-binding protein [Ruania zhangjianzhongii]|uniref:ABC transporter substrate-binding protein n=1 Tax=Ruania zhangjianzhongii TaxID=2603206 RepID=UPI0011C9EEEA|nr:ABC transporter substrate-binding protein [Ruania zhangjianzhongii]
MRRPTKPRAVAAVAGTAVFSLALAACSSEEADDGTVVIEYGWWGSAESNDATFAAIEAFEAENPEITVEGEASPWDGYWDKLATMTAGGDAPDVIHMQERYIREYGERGALADIRTLDGVDLDALDEEMVSLGDVDGALYALPAGVNTFTVAVNEDLFAEAGVEVPDDRTWTWEDYYEASAATASEDVTGVNYRAGIENLRPWLHQHGETMYNEEGTGVGFSREVLVSYLENILTQRENGGPTADQVSEEMGLPIDATLFGTGRQSMTWFYTSELSPFADAVGDHVRLMRVPSQTGEPTDSGMYLRGSSFYSVSAYADEEEQEAAAQFIDFMINDADALAEIGMLRGVPPNTQLVEDISGDLGESDQQVLDFVTELRPDLTVDPVAPSAPGTGNVQGIFDREVLEMLYDRTTPDEAADRIIEAIDSELA